MIVVDTNVWDAALRSPAGAGHSHKVERPWLLKLTTILITFFALGFALINSQSVFSMVIMAWSGLASAFAPLLIMLCVGFKPAQRVSVSAVIVGFLTALLWRLAGMHEVVYEGLPGITVGLGVYGLAWYLSRRSEPVADSEQTSQ